MSNFYEDNAKAFIDDTFNCDMSFQYNLFEKYLNNAEKIMDLGFGSGRDSLYFMSKGYDVYAIDPSESFCINAKKLGIKNVYNLYAQDIDFENMFDGIWACASLLHVSSKDLNFVFKKCSKALKKNGIIYASFKYGEFEKNGRYFLDLNESTINNYLKETNLKIKEYIITEDVRPDNSTKWLNVILTNK